jgi:hypothetical protein
MRPLEQKIRHISQSVRYIIKMRPVSMGYFAYAWKTRSHISAVIRL